MRVASRVAFRLQLLTAIIVVTLSVGTGLAQYRSPLGGTTGTFTYGVAHLLKSDNPDAPGGIDPRDYDGGCKTYCNYTCTEVPDATGKTTIYEGGLACDEWKNYQSCSKEKYCHLGTDLAAVFGNPVVAAASGKITDLSIANSCQDKPKANATCVEGSTCKCAISNCNNGMGNYVRMTDQFGRLLTYMHLREGSIPSTLAKGTAVAAGDPLGEVGCTGSTTGTHVHFEVTEDKQAQDPYAGKISGTVSLWMGGKNTISQVSYDDTCSGGVVPGQFADGLHLATDTDPISKTRAIQAAYGTYPYTKSVLKIPGASDLVALGCPLKSSLVHSAGDIWLQDFAQTKVDLRFDGSTDGETALVFSATAKKAFVLHSAFWGAYKCLSTSGVVDGAPMGGAALLGAPIENDHLGQPIDISVLPQKLPLQAVPMQTFEKGFVWWGKSQEPGAVDAVHIHLFNHQAIDEKNLAAGCGSLVILNNPPGPPICTTDEVDHCSDGIDNDCNKCTDGDDKACGACNGKQCGTTKCDQSCGTCTSPDTCDEVTGKCVPCQPNCNGKNCGPDGCGKMCGTCVGQCSNGVCCTPNCNGTVCGDNGCGQPCAECPGGAKCNGDGSCPKDTGACNEWDFAANWSTLGWFVPVNQGTSKGNVKPNGDWLVTPSVKDPQIDVKNIAVNGAKCNHLVAGMSTNCKYNNACIYFKTKNKVAKPDGTVVDCTKLAEDHKVCGPTCASNSIWCDAKFDLSQDICWTQGGDIVEIRFDYVDSMGQGSECPSGSTGDAGFSNIRLYQWGNECAEGTGPEVCYTAGPISEIKGACSKGVRFCEGGKWTPCVGETTPKVEVCDGKDNDCDGQTDEDEDAPMCTSFFVDNDGDGYGAFSKCLCAKSGKYQATSGGDCDDNNAQVNPGKNEQCNNLDDNCNGSVDESPILACDDGLPCTSDNCNAGKCEHQVLDGQCKIAGYCQAAGAQQPGQPCYKCDPNQSTSNWSPTDGAACDDNDLCTKNDTCKSGECGGTGSCDECSKDSDCQDDTDLCNGKPVCDVAANPKKCKPNAKDVVVCDTAKDTACQKTMCSAATGVCGIKNSNDGTACDADGSLCTTSDACKAGLCVAGAALACTDDNPCTDNGCDPAKGCTVTSNAAPCSDNNACTVGDVCAGETCKSGTPKPCADDNPCTQDGCDPAKGCTNVNMPAGTACGGPSCVGLSYTATPTCSSGACVPPVAQSCDDANGCTNDACSLAAGCSHLPNLEVCDDGNACTVIDKCTMGLCQGGSQKVCSDGNACTTDSCDKFKGCVFPALVDGTKCMAANCDGTSFFDAAVCKAGACQAPPGPVSCDDQNACTTDACTPGQGCTHTANTVDCSDSNACTVGDKCGSSTCIPGTAVACNDGNACTTDSCDPVKGCVTAANTAPCDDSDPCTINEKCSSGKCTGGTAVLCDDKDPCTVDACTVSVGCTTKAGNDGTTCDDGNACTVTDKCTGGSCKGTGKDCNDNNPCTADKCNPSTQGCYYEPAVDGTACEPAGCPSLATWQAAATCAVGKCGATPAPQSCDDQNACTVDTCNAQLGCQHGQAPACNDNNPCTDDKCDPAKGCVVAPNTAPCDDGNACTQSDLCVKGSCQGVTASCNDSNPCTSDACTPAKGCQYAAMSGACDADGKPCTADTCVNGKCQAGQPVPENCCNGIDDDCNGQTDECGIPLVVKYDALSSDKSLKLAYQSTADGTWTAVDTPGPGVQAAVKLCPGNGTARFNLNWATPIGGRNWACDSDTQGGAEPVGALPAVDVGGKPAAVAMLPGSNGRVCDFAVGVANGVPADPIVARPGELLVNSANLGNADCAILVGDYGEWLSGPAVAKQTNGFFSFKIPGGRFPAGVWRFTVAKPKEGCGVVGSIGTVNPGDPINKGGPWADATVAGMTPVGFTWAWSGDTLQWGKVVPSGSWRMVANASGVVLPAGSDSPLGTTTAFCTPGATRACSFGGCALEQTCLKHGWPFESVSTTAATWPASFWSECSPKANALPILTSDKCGDGIDADCDGMDELCSPLTGDGDFESYAGDGPWISWVGTSGASASVVQDVVARGSKAMRMTVPTASADFWIAQVQNKVVNVLKGKTYRLALWAAADKHRTMRITLEHSLNPADPNAGWVGDGVTIDLDLAPEFRRYEVYFVATNTVQSQLDFQFAEASGTVWLDGVTVAPVP